VKTRPMDDDLMRIVFGETGAQSDLPAPNYERARKTLRALLAVARAARRRCWCVSRTEHEVYACPIRKALARLDRLSQPPREPRP
jgi:hypothetical protein